MRLKPQTYALTTVAYERRNVFQRDAIAELCITTFFRCRDAGKFQLHAFVVMPNHVHAVRAPAPDQAIERVTDEEDLRNQILYIVNNPLKKGWTDNPHIHTDPAYASRMDPLPKI